MGGDRKEHGWLRKTVLSVARHVLIVRLGDDRIFSKDVVYELWRNDNYKHNQSTSLLATGITCA